jgi:uncharacterized protein
VDTKASEILGRKADVDVLARRYGVRRLDLFGSAARGELRADSDLDFLVEFDAPEAVGYADRYFGLLEALEQLFERPVDLVVASAVKNPYFLESVERSRILLYAS